jgi:hypothetical protein
LELNYRQAVAQQSWHRNSIRELMTALIDEYPNATDEVLIRRAIDKMREDEEWLVAAGEYAAMQTLTTLHRRKETAAPTPEVRAQRQAEQQAAVENIKEQILLLNLEMPNGKRLRYCTREEVAGFSKGYDRLAKKMKPGQMVGQAFDEAQVRALMK